MIHKYPYFPSTFFENKREYGLKEALKEDWYRTKESILDDAIVILATPILLYLEYKRRRSIKETGQLEEMINGF